MTTIVVMSETLPLAHVKARFSEIIDRVSSQDERVIVTRNGRPAAVLLSIEDLEGLEETLQVLSDADLLAGIREGQEAARAGDVTSLEDLRKTLAHRAG